ncbi:hypothetical protein SDC9_126942 [bioreactor metagenome]|uniref:DUF4340 domain-containing protein n=1 Tax=bioreactor metagenome TaxID=1076179 RepID=A0A645CRZ8_9ZZZZ
MIYPGNFVPSSYNYSTVILQHFITLVGESVEEYGINKYLTAQTSDEKTKFIEILNKYGFLDENGKFLYELSYSYDNVSTTLYVSKLDENNYYHIYSPRYDIIASMPKDSFSWIEWDLIKYVDSGIFSMNINNVKRIEFTSPSANASFDLSYINEGKKDDLTVMCEQSGKRVTTTNFREFYKQMLYVANAGYADSDNGEAASAQLKIITVDDIVRTYTFYDISSLRSYYTVDGNGNFYVSRSYVKKLIEDISLLLKDDFDVPAGSPDKIVVASRNDF